MENKKQKNPAVFQLEGAKSGEERERIQRVQAEHTHSGPILKVMPSDLPKALTSGGAS